MKTCVLFAVVAAALCAQVPVPPDLPPETVVATVDGRAITIAELRGLLENSPPNLIQAFQQRPQFAIQQLYMMRYLAAEGEKAKLAERSPIKEQLEIMRANIVAQAMLNQERDGFPVTEHAINSFYAQNKSRYEQARIKVIYIGFKPVVPTTAASAKDVEKAAQLALEAAHNQSQRTEAEAKNLATEIVKTIRGGDDFAKLVVERSEDATSKAAGGDFGVIKHNSSYSDDIKKAVFALKPGEVSDPVRQGNGFYIIRLEEKSVQPLDDVREPIVQEIRQAHLNDWFNALTRRFEPKIEKPEFFARPSSALPLPKSAARPNPLGPGKP